MLFENPFEADGEWYKGNLHTHTTNSDGAWSPDRVAAEYRAKGYNFLFITDHGTVTDVSGLSGDGLLVLNGTELGAGKSEVGHSYHLAVLNLKETVSAKSASTLQGLIDLLRSKGAEVIIAHPYWSGLTINDFSDLEGYVGVEVFNSTCHFAIAKGHSAVHWDDLLVRGKSVAGFAVDDAHEHSRDDRPLDICYAWIMAKLPELTEAAVMSAIKSGRFYASNGPTIHDISVKDGDSFTRGSKGKGQTEYTKQNGKPVVQYSNSNYNKICIEFKNGIINAEGNSENEVCNAIVEYAGTATGYQQATVAGAPSTPGSPQSFEEADF